MFKRRLKGSRKLEKLKNLKSFQESWIQKQRDKSEIIFSSRVRFARNLDNFPFPGKASEEELNQVKEILKKAISKDSFLRQLDFYSLEELSDLDQQLLLEEHLISPNFSRNGKTRRGNGRKKEEVGEGSQALILDKDQGFSIMINEEDHLRMQWLLPGFNLKEGWIRLSEIEQELSSCLRFAFSEKFGYLTACPTNVGTAMRASLMLHLPGLTLRKKIGVLVNILERRGVMVRGLFGEGTLALGNLYQISNEASLGVTEEEIIDNLTQVGKEIVEKEKKARRILLSKKEREIADNVQRSLGILTHARLISFEEAVELLSMVWLGMDLFLTPKKIKRSILSTLTVLIRPAHLRNYLGEDLNEEEENKARADLIRERLKV